MEADRIQGLSFVPEVFESERGVIASERRLGVENDNDAILSENVRATAIMAHPYHWDVIGWMSDILSWRRDEVAAYYRTYYAPNNAVLVVVGDIDPAKTLELVRKYYGPIKASPPPPPVSTVEPPQMGTKTVVIRKEAQTPSFMAVWHGPAYKDPDFFPLSILAKPLLEGREQPALPAARPRGGAGHRRRRRHPRDDRSAALHDRRQAPARGRPRPHRQGRRGGAGQDPGRGHHGPGIRQGPEHHPQRLLPGPADDLGQGRPARIRPSSSSATSPSSSPSWTTTPPSRSTGSRRPPRKIFVANNKTVGKLIPEGGAK